MATITTLHPPRPSTVLLEVDNVSLQYRTARSVVRATQEVSFDVHAAERFVLLGASGCGKSTLLKAIAGFLPPVEGEIRLDGRPVRGPGPDRVVVFQEFDQLPPWKTVRDNVAFPLLASRTLGRREAAERALHWLDKVGLARFAGAYPHQLSGGMKQRVEVARALAVDPDVLFLDEPFGALDSITRLTMRAELLRIWQAAKKTVLFVTHDVDESVQLADRVVVMSARPGRIQKIVDIDVPRPRDISSARYLELRDGILAEIGIAHEI